jgi:hypothetical protein
MFPVSAPLNQVRTAAAACLAIVVTGLAFGCGAELSSDGSGRGEAGSTACDANCHGCCVESACVGGTSPTACGRNGGSCSACTHTEVCTEGVCVNRSPARVVLAGGYNYAGDCVGSINPAPWLSDTWTWDGVGWTRESVSGPNAPVSPEMATLHGTGVLYGEFFGVSHDTLNPPVETWSWDGEHWMQQMPMTYPSARSYSAMAALNGTIVLFGGVPWSGPPSLLSDTWTSDGVNWTQRNVRGPSAREGHAMAALHGTLVLFGGLDNNGTTQLGDTWTWDGEAWTRQHPKAYPSPRSGHAMAALNDTVLLFGGYGSSTNLGDTWTWDGTTWTRHDVSGPSPRSGHAMTTLNSSVVLFGGASNTTDADAGFRYLGDTWTWDGATWTYHATDGPSPRSFPAMATVGTP